jgi:hypothetical protein
MTAITETLSRERQPRRWQAAVLIAIAAYFVIAELWARLFFAGNAPGPYRLLYLYLSAFPYGLVLPLLTVFFLVLNVLRVRRRERRTPWQPLLGAGLMLVLSLMLCVGSASGDIHQEAAAMVGNQTYYLVKNYTRNRAFPDLMLVECDGAGLACRASYYNSLKAQETARLALSPSGQLEVNVCNQLTNVCRPVDRLPQP